MKPLLSKIDEARVALMFLTRLPMGHVARTIPLGQTAWAWPLAGLASGSAMALGPALTAWTNLPPMTGVILGMGLALWVTGGLHEDGLADCADGVGGGGEREKRLAIMRDSRIGTYGVLVLVVILALQASLWQAAQALWMQAMTVGLLSRAGLPAWMALFAPARPAGLGTGTRGDLSTGGCAAAAALGLVGACALVGQPALPAAVMGGLVQAMVFLAAKRGLGGFTGDVVGAAQVLGQTASLAVLVQLQ